MLWNPLAAKKCSPHLVLSQHFAAIAADYAAAGDMQAAQEFAELAYLAADDEDKTTLQPEMELEAA